MASKRTIIALDVDGTLEEYGGLISRETIERLKPYTHIGICSSRGDAWLIAQKYGLGFGETGKSLCLFRFKQLWGKDCVGFLYIGDTDLDRMESVIAGWNFVNVRDIRLNLGCGEDIKFGYINIDIRPVQGVNLILDLERDDLPFQANLCTEIIMQDVLEHIHYDRVEHLLRECHRVLKPNGRLYIRTPDLERIYEKVIVRGESLDGRRGYRLLSYFIFGGMRNPYDYHKCIFTKSLLRSLLESVGFRVESLINDNTNILCWCRKIG